METIEDWLRKIKECEELIVVEGKKDKAALESLGVTNIRCLSNPLFQEVEDIVKEHKKVIILTDLDKEGKKIYGRLRKDFNRFGVDVDNKFREWLFKNTKLRQIEGIDTYLRNHAQ
ncbi:toprim domain-containing protein [Candidatus Woesearchaeota archaeon]|nr:toprim domain-containing protein [Candidatus Woesearchaeota archaeon]